MCPIRARDTLTPTILLPTRRSRAASRRQASCQVTAFRVWLPSVGVKNWTLGGASPELFLRRFPVVPATLRMELLRRMELRFLSEFWCDSSLFWRVWIKMDGFSSSSLALQGGVATFKNNNRTFLEVLAMSVGLSLSKLLPHVSRMLSNNPHA